MSGRPRSKLSLYRISLEIQEIPDLQHQNAQFHGATLLRPIIAGRPSDWADRTPNHIISYRTVEEPETLKAAVKCERLGNVRFGDKARHFISKTESRLAFPAMKFCKSGMQQAPVL